MPDHLPAIKSITVWEYLDFFGRCYGLKADARSKRISYLEEFTGLGSMRNKQLHSLSKGMKPRVCLARALIHNPEIMIMDEPAAGLDPQARIELRGMIKTLAAEGKGIFLSSHILSDLDEICDCAVIIEKGRLLSFGPVAQMAEKQNQRSRRRRRSKTDRNQYDNHRNQCLQRRFCNNYTPETDRSRMQSNLVQSTGNQP